MTCPEKPYYTYPGESRVTHVSDWLRTRNEFPDHIALHINERHSFGVHNGRTKENFRGVYLSTSEARQLARELIAEADRLELS